MPELDGLERFAGECMTSLAIAMDLVEEVGALVDLRQLICSIGGRLGH